MEKIFHNNSRKVKDYLINNLKVMLSRWMLVSQILQGLLILAVGYIYRNIKKMSKLQNAKLRMGTVIPNDV